MLSWLFFLYPILAGMLAFTLKSKRKMDILIVLHATLHLALGFQGFMYRGSIGNIDDLGLFVLLIAAVLYMMVAVYRFDNEKDTDAKKYKIHTIFLMLFIAAIDGACLFKDMGWIWVFIEATTITSAMLISTEHTKQSLEAAWKYLFICSVGIALAFVGILLLVIAQPEHASLIINNINAKTISPFWLKLSFIFMMVGFGTKIGLAPLHFWLPDAHSESPAPISALLSGALLNTALLPILRMDKLMRNAGLENIAHNIFLLMGFLSIFIATVFILKTKNYKRMLAYSSIENMGLIMLAFGSGGIAIYAGYLHILGHSLIKSALFLVAGNIVAIYHDKHYANINGLINTHKPSGWLWMIAFAMLIGMPPSPLFISEFLIATALLSNQNYIGFIALMIMLATIAYTMGNVSLKMCMSKNENKISLPLWTYISPTILLIIASILGVWLPVLD